MMKSDRIFGAVVVLGAFAYIAGALQTPTSFMSDPVGPKTFPVLIGAVAALCGLVMAIRPDQEPEWPELRVFGALVVSVFVLVVYAYSLKSLGFILPTAIASGILSYQISQRRRFAAISGAAIAVGLFVIFKYALGLSLVALPRVIVG